MNVNQMNGFQFRIIVNSSLAVRYACIRHAHPDSNVTISWSSTPAASDGNENTSAYWAINAGQAASSDVQFDVDSNIAIS